MKLMSLLKKELILLTLILFIGNISCVDSSYDWDNLNKKGVLEIPPIPLGTYPAVSLEALDYIVIDIPNLPVITMKYKYVLENLFDKSTVKAFFHSNMTKDFSIDGRFHMFILGEESNIKLAIDLDVLDQNNDIIKGIKIDGISEDEIVYGIQDISIKFPEKAKQYMTTATHLQITFRLTTPRSVNITSDDYVRFENLLIHPAGWFVEL